MCSVPHFLRRKCVVAARAAASLLFILTLLLSSQTSVRAQSQALNGQIEGTVTDVNGERIPNATITVTNVETGTTRNATSDESGAYTAPLLPLGTYRLTVEAPNFKRLVREGITLVTGQTATIDLNLQLGEVSEVVTVSGDAPIADAARIDVSRVLNEREVRNLPLVSRNPYNFGLLQANVVGRPNAEFGVPRISANGFARRANYQLDGNNNTQTDRAGIRLMPISETFVSEVQLVTNGFAAEFGNTPGIIFNTVTPSGTNNIRGSVGYRLRRTPFYARPFFYPSANELPDTKSDNLTAQIGGPIIRDRWQYYAGYELVDRDLTSESIRLSTISAANRSALVAAGLSEAAIPPVIPVSQRANFFIFRTDVQVNDANRLVGRYNTFRNTSPNNIQGGLNTLERSVDFIDAADSVGTQLVSTVSPTVLNELRYQFARRNSRFFANENSGTGPTVVITGIANFGAPEDDNTISPLETTNQILDNVTINRGDHTIKFGGGFNVVRNMRLSNVFARYTFSSVAAYVAALNGTAPRGYSSYVESFGEPKIRYGATFYQFFAQDDWKLTPRLKINYGLRYDLYDVPEADRDAALDFQRDFRVDKNNFAPRVGLVYALREGDRPTVVRASAGLYYEPPQLDIYRRAILNNGNPRFFNFTFTSPTQAGAPAFPNTLGSLPPGTALPRQSIEAVSPDYENVVAFHTNLQVEQALTRDLSVTLGFINSRGTHLPVYRNINLINPVSFLADGRPVFSSTVIPTTRLFPQFNNIFMVESVGTSNYTAGTISVNKRFSQGYQFSANYTLSHAIDDAPEENLVAATNFRQSDPTNRRFDRGNSLADQRHTFVLSFVGRPTFQIENRFLRSLLNDNQIGIIAIANSGETFNILSNQDLNRDGFISDRPLFIGRNTGNTPNQYNVDMRYSRFVRFSERFNAEIFGEFTNLFNRNSIAGVNSTVTTDANGNLLAPLPDFTTRGPSSLDARAFQLGFKFNF